jgi:hypothetical protein
MLKTERQTAKEDEKDAATASGLSHEQIQKLITSGVDDAPSKKHVRVVTITVSGTDAGPIAAGLTNAICRLARDIEARRQGTLVKVSQQSID